MATAGACEPRRVVVIGAGLAGLAAADELARRGVAAIVLEARDRVGGRVWSRTLANGAVVEMGAEFVLPGNDELRATAARLGLELEPRGMAYGRREPRGGIGVDAAQLEDALAAVRKALPAAGARSAAAFLAELPIAAGAREALLARLEVSAANAAERVGASELAGLAAHSDEDCPSIAGGNQRLALALASVLPAPPRLASPVERVIWSDVGVRVWAAGGELEADAAVLALPAAVFDRIVFEPALPAPLRDALAAVEIGQAAKLFVPLRKPAPASAVLSVPERYWTWTARGAGGQVQPVVSAFAGSPRALTGLGVDGGPGRWLASLAALRPDLALDPGGAVLSTWHDDPWAGGAYSTHGPSPASSAALEQQWGPLVLCGEHTAGPWAALMEGALRSGRRAARLLAGGRA